MSNDDNFDEEIRLRDQFAMAAMQALIDKYGVLGRYIENEADIKEEPYRKMERITLAAYKIADEMRKARLISFK